MMLLAILTLAWPGLRAQEPAVWVDLIPMTRHLLGAEAETGLRMSAGWGSNLNGTGWRTLLGVAASQETRDSFGTTITTRNQSLGLRAGRRWFKDRGEETARCRPVWGTDVVVNRTFIGTESSGNGFTSTNSTTILESGFSGVLGVDLMLAPRLHLIAETRFDALYRNDVNVQEDNFSGRFEQRDEGWRTRLDPPLQLYVALGL